MSAMRLRNASSSVIIYASTSVMGTLWVTTGELRDDSSLINLNKTYTQLISKLSALSDKSLTHL